MRREVLEQVVDTPDVVADGERVVLAVVNRLKRKQGMIVSYEGIDRNVVELAHRFVEDNRPTERDRQASAEGATRARSPVPSRKPGIEKDGELARKRRLGMAGAVVRSLIADPAAHARLMDRAWARIAPIVARAKPDKTRSGYGNPTRRRER